MDKIKDKDSKDERIWGSDCCQSYAVYQKTVYQKIIILAISNPGHRHPTMRALFTPYLGYSTINFLTCRHDVSKAVALHNAQRHQAENRARG